MSDEKQYIFGVTCPHCGHITYFDKRRVCSESVAVYRDAEFEGQETRLDELELECGSCGEEIIVKVDCEGYR